MDLSDPEVAYKQYLLEMFIFLIFGTIFLACSGPIIIGCALLLIGIICGFVSLYAFLAYREQKQIEDAQKRLKEEKYRKWLEKKRYKR